MAFRHSHSSECVKSELDLFTIPPTQTSLGEEYIDLAHTMIKVRARIVRPDRAAALDDSVGPLLRLQIICPHSLEFHFGLRIAMDSTAVATGDARTNNGLAARQAFTKGGKTFDLLGHLHCDVFNQDKFLMNGVELRVRLIRAKDAYRLMDDSALNYKVHIEEASLLVRRVKLSPGILIAHTKTLAKTTAKYPLTRVEVKSFVLHRGIMEETIDNAILGQLPNRFILGFVENVSFNGSRKKNPFNFQNFGINFLCLNVDGRQVPTKPLQPSFTSDVCLDVEAFNTLFAGTGTHFGDHGNNISRPAYSEGFCLFAFDLTPDLSASSAGHWNLVKSGSIRIQVRIHGATEKNINCVLYAEYDNLLEIDSTRQVIVDYSG
ncbi:uncharacterized protein F54H12.2-like [Diachasmimorpha longicaudata]|uniref:uncharacterized protein F54H12.2-like n=1 Tax=Diachasmimorpha longicaudata TaxID=58733 RepID=UPI0030B89471